MKIPIPIKCALGKEQVEIKLKTLISQKVEISSFIVLIGGGGLDQYLSILP